ncbi:hypothetical protein Nizo1840_2810 [Lactiplantibacillus plantarum]|nr:hypothetical protein Nizo1840_2810 [Lactiplantibacillus plantarum]
MEFFKRTAAVIQQLCWLTAAVFVSRSLKLVGPVLRVFWAAIY